MGNPKQKWKPEEEEALKAGVAKHGTGKWKNIQKDPEFNHLLNSRSNIDLKDKWRNMTVAAGQVPREKSRTPKAKASTDIPAASLPSTEPSAAEPVARNVPVVDGKNLLDEKCAAQYNTMILEALSVLRDPNGSDAGAILNFIEQKHAVPSSFKRQLGSRLKKLMQEDKIEKVQNCFFRLKSMTLSGTRTVMPKQMDNRAKEMRDNVYMSSDDTLEEAAVAAAYRVAEAENKSFLASEAIKEAERIAKMAEDADSLLMFAKEIFEKCSQGEIVLAA